MTKLNVVKIVTPIDKIDRTYPAMTANEPLLSVKYKVIT
jgi:hypothetical protein